MTNIQLKPQQTILRYKKVIKSYIRAKRLKIGNIQGQFCLGTTFTEWLIDFTNYAKIWSELMEEPLTLQDTIVKDAVL